jgi:hypothetical protein
MDDYGNNKDFYLDTNMKSHSDNNVVCNNFDVVDNTYKLGIREDNLVLGKNKTLNKNSIKLK